MSGVLSKLSPLSDRLAGYSRPATSVAHRFDGASDADIRNLVEGYALEGEVSDVGETRFEAWYDETFLADPEALDDRHYRAALRAAFVSGWLSMAREVGQLPSTGAA